jgi:molecular chaperone Hsp33
MLVGREELIDMLEKDGGAELTCHFCNTRYGVSGDELQALIAELAPAT